MKKSKYINPEFCKHCGSCCKSFSIVYPKKLEKIEPNMFSEIQRFRDLDTDKIVVKEDKNNFEVEFLFPCKHLIEKDKVFSCDIYNSGRPLLCQEYPYKNTNKLDCPFKK